jgi:hypothetical protein
MLIVSNQYESLYKLFESSNTKLATEATLKGGNTDSDYSAHHYKYAINVINILLSGDKLPLGSQGADGYAPSVELTDNAKIELQNLKDNIQSSTEKDFNRIVRDFGFTWSKIYKSDEIKSGGITSRSADADASGKKTYTKYTNSLKPQNLGLLGTIPSAKFVSKIKEGLDNSVLTDSLKSALYDLCKNLNTKKYAKKSIDDLIMEGNKGKKAYEIECSLSAGADKAEIKAASNEIDKDFGEVIGAIVLLKSITGATSVNYDTSVTGEMIDYTINTKNDSIGVSAKALNGGHPPAASTLFRAMREFVVSGQQIGETTFKDLISGEKGYIDKPEKAKDAENFFILMEDINDQSVKYQWFALIDNFAKGNARAALQKFTTLFAGKGKTLLNFLDSDLFGESSLEKNFATKFDELCSTKKGFEKVLDVLNSVSTACDSKPKDIPTDAESAKKLDSKTKIGMFIYPFEAYVVKELNKNFGLGRYGNSDVDVISAFARLAFSHKQIYLGTSVDAGDSVKVKYKIVAMDEADWAFTTSGNGSSRPFSQVIGIHIVL